MTAVCVFGLYMCFALPIGMQRMLVVAGHFLPRGSKEIRGAMNLREGDARSGKMFEKSARKHLPSRIGSRLPFGLIQQYGC